MENFKQPASFKNDPVTITVGAKNKAILIADLAYGKKKEFFALLVKLWFERETAPASADLLREQVQRMITPEFQVAEAIKKIETDLLSLYDSQKEDQVIALLVLLTGGQLSEEEIQNDLGGDEAINLLVWLLNRNLEARKNLNASLNSILSPTGKSI